MMMTLSSAFLLILLAHLSEPASIGSDDSVQLTDDGQENPETSRVKRDAWTAIDFGNSLANMAPSPPSHSHSGQSNNLHTAVTFGRGHVITFDGKYFHLPDETEADCIHVLARDRVHYRFTMMRTRRSLSLLTQHTAITLHQNNKVEINNTGTYRDLPVESWDHSLAVTHDNTAVVIQSQSGITIECDLHHSQCLYQLTAIHHNTSVGLLGTNDRQSNNDFTMRTGQITTDVHQFTNSYEVSGLSYCRSSAVTSSSTTQCQHPHRLARCRQLFQSVSSTLQSCFSHVDPQPFLEACEHDARRCDSAHSLCDSVLAYTRMCQKRGISVSNPHDCARCDGHASGAVWQEKANKKLDVILAVSLRDTVLPSGTQMSSVLRRLSDTIGQLPRKHEGIRHNIRLGLLGFGGSGFLSQPHVYTIQGESFSREHSNAIWRQTLDSVTATSAGSTGEIAAVLEAVAQYPFRTDAAKVVILITDTTSQAANQATLNSLQRKFSRHGISLNVVAGYSALSARHVLGARGSDRSLLYDRRQVTTTQTMQFPTDLGSRLAQFSHGALFDLTKVVQGRHPVLNAIQNEIYRQLVWQNANCRQCRCPSSGAGLGQATCQTQQCS